MSGSSSTGGAEPLAPAGASDEEVAGLVIADRYRLDRKIGTGGMATVWEATHLTLNRAVAIKLIDVAGPRSARLTERFLREARVAGAIRHRNVVDITDFGTTETGRPFMAMELLVGRPLSQLLDGQTHLTVGEVVQIMARVLSGLGAVHDAGIVHRDLKPENIFLVEDADGVYPKLLDFGVSRADPRTDLESVMPTTENAIVGTPQYMSPEQARVLKDLDHRSDLWSAGVILFEMLSGRLPYDADAVGDVIIQIATEEPPDLATLRPDLAGPLTAVVMKALSRRPEDRFATARDMRAALLAATAHVAQASTAGSGEHPILLTHQGGLGDLRDALTAAYEPGDSSVIDVSQHLAALDLLRAEGSEPAPARASTPRRWQGVALGVLAGAALLGGAGVVMSLGADPPEARPRPVASPPAVGQEEPATAATVEELAPAPAAPVHVQLRLEDLPGDAEVTVDGAPVRVEGPLELTRGETHEVEVRAPDGRRWTHTHGGEADETARVTLPPASTRRRRRGRRTARGSAGESNGLIRTPDF